MPAPPLLGPPTKGDVEVFVRMMPSTDTITTKILLEHLTTLYGRDMSPYKGVAIKLLGEVLSSASSSSPPSSATKPSGSKNVKASSSAAIASGHNSNQLTAAAQLSAAHSARGRKAILCLHLKKPEGCRNGENCEFAHSAEEAARYKKLLAVPLPHKQLAAAAAADADNKKKAGNNPSSVPNPHNVEQADALRIRKSILCSHLKKPEGCQNDNCEFAHTIEEEARYKKSLIVRPPVPKGATTTTTTAAAASSSSYPPRLFNGGAGGTDNTCHRYNSPGGCPFGASCRFEHPSSSSTTTGENNNNNPTNKPVCKWVGTSAGCRLGDRCNYFHPPTSSNDSPAVNLQPARMHTEMCKFGVDCPRYDRQTDTVDDCWFAHNEGELRCLEFALHGVCEDEDCTLKHTKVGMTDRVANPDEMLVKFVGLRPGERPGDRERQDMRKSLVIADGRRFPFFEVPNELMLEMAQNRSEAVKKTPFIGNGYLANKYTLGLNPRPGAVMLHTALSKKKSYIDLFGHLLSVEVCQSRSDVRRYDIKSATVTPTAFSYGGQPLYRIQCAGLVEKRPSVIRGDAVVARDNSSGVWHRGFVHEVHLDEVHVSFHAEFNKNLNTTHWIIFSAPMATYRRQFYALSHAPVTLTLDVIAEKAISSYNSSYAIDPAILGTLNEEQVQAVKRLAGSTPGSDDSFRFFILHGPPGTGKTTTVVAAIANMLLDARSLPKGARRKRILVCTPTNHAANLIVEKLVSRFPWINSNHLLRLVAQGVTSHDVSKAVVEGFFVAPHTTTTEELCAVDIIVTTIVSSGMLYQCGMPTEHFDHIIIDEAGQATEPELSVPLLMAGGSCPAITLVGDHKQLGPVLRSLAATAYCLGDSAMERIMRNETNREKFSLKLLKSYRSHPSILRIYNELTYDGALVAAAPPNKTNKLLGCTVFPNAREPIGFLHVEGTESREADSPSWMNAEEVVCVLWVVKQFLDFRIDPSEIVILSPYQKQCKKIRGKIIEKFGMEVSNKLTVCSVESYQGREATVVILSCVRSISLDERQRDMVQGIGFLKQPKRLNVAISRAVAGLYIVGNVGMLQTDGGWTLLIKKMLEVSAVRSMDGRLTAEDVSNIGKRYVDELGGKKLPDGVAAKTMIPDAIHAAKIVADGGNAVDNAWRREM